MDDELDITLRPAAEVAARAIVLASLLRRLALEPIDGAAADDAAGEAFDLRAWLHTEGLATTMTALEAAAMQRAPGSMTPDEIAEISWQGEALAALAWSLGLAPEQSPDRAASIESLLAAVPEPWDAVNRWIDEANLLAESAIARERERAELWHWRAVTESLRREAPPDERRELESAIREVAMDALASGVLAQAVTGDFAVEGVAMRAVPARDLDRLVMISRERLHALNWLCGFGDSWNEVPLDI